MFEKNKFRKFNNNSYTNVLKKQKIRNYRKMSKRNSDNFHLQFYKMTFA